VTHAVAADPGTGLGRLDGSLRTEYPFVLPRGFVDDGGVVHRDGVMRLATARDEILPQRDPRVRENEAYLTVLLLSRVITRLGSLPEVHPGVVETDMIRGVINRAPDPKAARAQFEGMAPMKRMAQVDEVAGLVVFLASDEAAFVSGSEYGMDGATTAGMMGV